MKKEKLYLVHGMLDGEEHILDVFVRTNAKGTYVCGVYRSGEEREELDDGMEDYSLDEIKSRFNLVPVNKITFQKKFSSQLL